VDAPGLLGSTSDWLNTGGKELDIEAGKVHVVRFWAFGCIYCKRNLPAYARWCVVRKYWTEGYLSVLRPSAPWVTQAMVNRARQIRS